VTDGGLGRARGRPAAGGGLGRVRPSAHLPPGPARGGRSEEKAAEIETAVEYEIKIGGGNKDPVTRSLAERLERIRQKKAEADTDMLTLLAELVREVVSEKHVQESLQLSDRAQGFLALGRTYAPSAAEDTLVQLARDVEAVVGRNATFAGWAERDDILRDIRRETIKLLLQADATKHLVSTAYVDEVLQTATARTGGTA
jgi:hypothetical protein